MTRPRKFSPSCPPGLASSCTTDLQPHHTTLENFGTKLTARLPAWPVLRAFVRSLVVGTRRREEPKARGKLFRGALKKACSRWVGGVRRPRCTYTYVERKGYCPLRTRLTADRTNFIEAKCDPSPCRSRR